MTVHEQERELEALEQEGESVATIVAGLDTTRLHILADAIRAELTERQVGKPWEKLRLH